MARQRQISESTRRGIKELFDLFDKNNDGEVSVNELILGLRWDGNNPTKSEINALLKDMGVKKGENITYDKFEKCVEKYYEEGKLSKEAEEERLVQSFKMFDRNNNGSIEIKELKWVLKNIGDKMTDKEIEDMFREADKNKDGKIQYKEFIRLFTQDMK